jgi:hypothetical protein
LTPDAERTLLNAIRDSWGRENRAMFRGALRPPVLALSRGGPLGSWTPAGRLLTLDRDLVARAPWGQVVEVLRHELAHQYVHEVLGVHDQTAHGDAFRRVCARQGVDARAAGWPDARDAEESPIVRRVRKLLALADSPEPHEAAAAMAKARRLMAEHALPPGGDAPQFTTAWPGEVWLRRPAWARQLGGLLTVHFQVAAIWIPALHRASGQWGSQLEISGSASDVDVAGYVWDFVVGHGERGFRAIRPPPRGQGAQARYLSGVVAGLHERLDAAARRSPSEALVHVGPAGLDAYMHARHPTVRHQRVSVRIDGSFDRGRAAGHALQIRPGVGAGGPPRGGLPGP